MDTATRTTEAMDLLTLPKPGTLPEEADVETALVALRDVRDELNAVVLARGSLIDTALLCLLTGEHLLQLGPPGTAKSLLMEEIGRRIVDPSTGKGLTIFRRLMDKFCTPEMLFGPIDAALIKQSVYRHLYQGTFATADVVFLDEVFKSSTAILNSLLLAINERQADIGTNERIHIPLITMFLASNEGPTDIDALLAFYDRILMRAEVRYLDAADFSLMLQSRAAVNKHRMYRAHGHWYVQQNPEAILDDVIGDERPNAFISRTQLYLLQQAVPFVTVPPSIIGALTKIRSELGQKGINPSDRRWGQLLPVLQANALMHDRGEVNDEDLPAIIPALWNKPDEITEITKQVRRAGNPHSAKIKELLETAQTTFASYKKALAKATNESERMTVSADAMTNIRSAHQELSRVKTSLEAQKQDAAVKMADQGLATIKGLLLEVTSALAGV